MKLIFVEWLQSGNLLGFFKQNFQIPSSTENQRYIFFQFRKNDPKVPQNVKSTKTHKIVDCSLQKTNSLRIYISNSLTYVISQNPDDVSKKKKKCSLDTSYYLSQQVISSQKDKQEHLIFILFKIIDGHFRLSDLWMENVYMWLNLQIITKLMSF